MILPIIITIIGPPGSGKGTQGALIAEKYNLNYVVAGNIIRRLVALDTPLGESVRANYNKGILQPDKTVIWAVKEEISKMDINKGFLLDSFPLSLVQAEALNEILKNYNLPDNVVIYLDISADTGVNRISQRLICSKCSTVFFPADSVYKTKKCSKCGGDLITRSDDKPEVVRTRITEYKSRMLDLKNYYAQRKRLIIINGEPAVSEISKHIFSHIDEFFKTKPLSQYRGK